VANSYHQGRLTIDFATREVLVDGRRCNLTPLEFKLLEFLVQHPRRAYSREALLTFVWGPRTLVKPRTIDVHIRRLRQQIERDASQPEVILSVRKVGYRFNQAALE
jgi:DNA-binding response OmpR family regulator